MTSANLVKETIKNSEAIMKDGSGYFLKLLCFFAPFLFIIKIVGLVLFISNPYMLYITNSLFVIAMIYFSFLWFKGLFDEGDKDNLKEIPRTINYILMGILVFFTAAFLPIIVGIFLDYITIHVVNSFVLNVAADLISIALSVALFYCALRLCFIFPAIVDGIPLSIKSAWKLVYPVDSIIIRSFVRASFLYAIFSYIYTRGVYMLYKKFIEIEGGVLVNEILFFVLICPVPLFIYPYLVAMLTTLVGISYRDQKSKVESMSPGL